MHKPIQTRNSLCSKSVYHQKSFLLLTVNAARSMRWPLVIKAWRNLIINARCMPRLTFCLSALSVEQSNVTKSCRGRFKRDIYIQPKAHQLRRRRFGGLLKRHCPNSTFLPRETSTWMQAHHCFNEYTQAGAYIILWTMLQQICFCALLLPWSSHRSVCVRR